MDVYPLIFKPIFKPRIWGGRKLETLLDKSLPAGEKIGESWEVADLEDDQSIVANGPVAGRGLGELVKDWGTSLIGRAELFEGRFPLLIKFLDANENLSVQVHPDEAMAKRLGGDLRVKHEAWYVLETEGDAAIYKGLKPGVTRESFASAIEAGTCAELLHRVPVKPGDCHYLPSGTVHALGAGVLVAEIQTPSDVTYRVFDWNRVDSATGQPRELHIAEALECIHFGPADESAMKRSHVASHWTTVTRLVTCESFIIEKVRMAVGVEQRIAYAEPVVWIVLTGRGKLVYGRSKTELPFKPGDTVLLPAELADARVVLDDDTAWLEITIPTASDLAGYA
ncbi:MAG: class I mannose-6-phosphate isomerase, partial [Planctomycetes bacterium]|nr:class I mannose-6-phosphate isomerase [Planctomycetota bacterium]